MVHSQLSWCAPVSDLLVPTVLHRPAARIVIACYLNVAS